MKKRVILLFITILCSLPSMAQQEFAPIGAKWYTNQAYTIGNNQFKVDSLESLKDTMVQDKTCRLINEHIVYQEADKVYYLYDDTLRLIYDFGVETGDTVTFEMFNCSGEILDVHFTIDTIESIMYQDIVLRQVTASQIITPEMFPDEMFPYQEYIYLDRFGSIIDFLYRDACSSFSFEYVNSWLRCYIDSEIEFHTPQFFNSEIAEEGCDYVAPLVGIESVNANDVICYPNPFHNQLTVQNNDLRDGHLDVFDVTGKLIYTTVIHTNQLDLGHLDVGLYFIVVRDGRKEVYREKVIKVE